MAGNVIGSEQEILLLKKGLAKLPHDPELTDELIWVLLSAESDNNVSEATELIQDLRRTHPGSWRVARWDAEAAMQAKQWGGAISHLEIARERAAGNLQPLQEIARTFLWIPDAAARLRGQEILRTIIEADHRNFSATALLALSLEDSGKTLSAEEIDPVEAVALLGRVKQIYGEEGWSPSAFEEYIQRGRRNLLTRE